MPPSTYLRPSRNLLIIGFGGVAAGVAYQRFKSRNDDLDDAKFLNPQTFASYRLIEKQAVSSTSSIFTLRSANAFARNDDTSHDQELRDVWRKCIWSVQAKQPQLQIARSYTPLPPIEDLPTLAGDAASGDSQSAAPHRSPGDFRFLIRAEKNGEVSNYLHSLPHAAEVGLRGPFVELPLPSDLQDVIFIAGGTGIAPALQVAHILSRRPGARMHIFWGVRHKDECLGGQSDKSERLPTTASQRRTLSDWDPWSKISRYTAFGLGQSEPAKLSKPLTAPADAEEKNLIVQELEALKAKFRTTHKDGSTQSGLLTVEYFVDDENRFVKPRDVSKRMREISEQEEERGAASGTKLILISGPDGFIDLWAGKKSWVGGKEVQGPLGGYFANFGLKSTNWKIWKL